MGNKIKEWYLTIETQVTLICPVLSTEDVKTVETYEALTKCPENSNWSRFDISWWIFTLRNPKILVTFYNGMGSFPGSRTAAF